MTFTATARVSTDTARASAAGLLWNLLLIHHLPLHHEHRHAVPMRAAELGAVPLLLYLIANSSSSHARCNAAGACLRPLLPSSCLSGIQDVLQVSFKLCLNSRCHVGCATPHNLTPGCLSVGLRPCLSPPAFVCVCVFCCPCAAGLVALQTHTPLHAHTPLHTHTLTHTHTHTGRVPCDGSARTYHTEAHEAPQHCQHGNKFSKVFHTLTLCSTYI